MAAHVAEAVRISVSLERHDTKIWMLSSINQFDFG